MVHHKYRMLILSFDFVVGSVSKACVSLAGLEHALETRLPLRLFLEDRGNLDCMVTFIIS